MPTTTPMINNGLIYHSLDPTASAFNTCLWNLWPSSFFSPLFVILTFLNVKIPTLFPLSIGVPLKKTPPLIIIQFGEPGQVSMWTPLLSLSFSLSIPFKHRHISALHNPPNNIFLYIKPPLWRWGLLFSETLPPFYASFIIFFPALVSITRCCTSGEERVTFQIQRWASTHHDRARVPESGSPL